MGCITHPHPNFNGSLAKPPMKLVMEDEFHSTVLLYKLRSVQSAGTCYPGQGWFVRCTWQIQPRPGWHVPIFCTDLNLLAYIFLICFLIPLWVWLGNLQDCQYAQCPLPFSIVIRMRLVMKQTKLPACLAEVQLAHRNTLWHLSHSLVKMTDKMDEICINRKFSAQEPRKMEIL